VPTAILFNRRKFEEVLIESFRRQAVAREVLNEDNFFDEFADIFSSGSGAPSITFADVEPKDIVQGALNANFARVAAQVAADAPELADEVRALLVDASEEVVSAVAEQDEKAATQAFELTKEVAKEVAMKAMVEFGKKCLVILDKKWKLPPGSPIREDVIDALSDAFSQQEEFIKFEGD
jgi:hypothetical protein